MQNPSSNLGPTPSFHVLFNLSPGERPSHALGLWLVFIGTVSSLRAGTPSQPPLKCESWNMI